MQAAQIKDGDTPECAADMLPVILLSTLALVLLFGGGTGWMLHRAVAGQGGCCGRRSTQFDALLDDPDESIAAATHVIAEMPPLPCSRPSRQ
jgi:hypothetical protein